MHHFVLPDPIAAPGSRMHFPDGVAHQIDRVLRLAVGERVVCLDGSGTAAVVRLVVVSRSAVYGDIEGPAALPPEPPVQVEVWLAAIRPERFAWAVQKGTELGVSRFLPILSRYCMRGDLLGRVDRMSAIAREAAEQSHRRVVPDIGSPLSIEDALHSTDDEGATLRVMLYEQGAEYSALYHVVGQHHARRICLLIGPEGGWHPDEVRQARLNHWQVAHLGPRILRAETAALVSATFCLQAYGAFDAALKGEK